MPSSSRRKSGKGGSSSRNRRSSSQASGKGEPPRNKKHKSTSSTTTTAAEPEFFTVKKIVGTKVVNGVKLYKTRWEGYTPDDDTWEPLDHVASTGHVDRYERKQRELTLSTYTPGVAVIEYDDGERQTIDLLQEKFRSWMDVSDDERDDDSVNGDDDVNNFDLIHGGAMIELLWPHAQIYFSCKVISWTPISNGDDKKDKKTVMRHGSLLWKMKDGKKPESVEADEKSNCDIAPTTTIPPPALAEGAAAGCKKCKRELKTGKQTRKEHSDDCPRKYSSASPKPIGLDVKQKSPAVQNGGGDVVTTDKSSDAPTKKERRRPGHEKEKSVSVTKYKSSDAPIDKNRLGGGEKESAESAMSKAEAKSKCDVDPTTYPSRAEGAAAGCKECKRELKTGEKCHREHSDHCPRNYNFKTTDLAMPTTASNKSEVKHKLVAVHKNKRSRPDEKERAEGATGDNSNDAPIKKRSRCDVEEEGSETVSKDKSNDLPNKKRRKCDDEEEGSETFPKGKSNDLPIKQMSRPDNEEKSAETVPKGKSNDLPIKKKSRPDKEKSAETVPKGKSNDSPLKKKSKLNKEEGNTTHGNPELTSTVDFDTTIVKTGAQIKEAKCDNDQKGGHVVKENHSSKKAATYPVLPLRDVSKDVSDDDSEDAISTIFRTRNVSEDMTASVLRKASKQDTSTSLTDVKESVADEMDIDALAAEVAMNQSHPAAQKPPKSAAGKHDVYPSQHDTEEDKQPSKEKVGRGVPLYSDDDDYESSEDEGRGEREFFQPTSHPRDRPKLSFEEMWMMKLQRTQSIMDRNNGTRRW